MEAASGSSEDRNLRAARGILSDFARRTGLEGPAPPRRYLWTDAFAVCTFLALDRGREGAREKATEERPALDSALRLVDQVHETLGRHREDDARTGWISGLPPDEGREHPTRGGLRIGKPLAERAAGEPFDELEEWERDGQYFHYLTKWMHALACVARVTGERRFLGWAIELALAAHAGFTRAVPGGGRRLVWKMSIDLTRPLVPSTGKHDPLDALLTYRWLRADAARTGREAEAAALAAPIEEARAMCAGGRWATTDALGIGGLLADAYRLARLTVEDDPVDAPMLAELLEGAAAGLVAVVHSGALEGPAERRLAFRELGLAIGLHATERLARLREDAGSALHVPGLERLVGGVRRYVPLAEHLESFWLARSHRASDSWRSHLDINAVTLAASLMPDGYLAPAAR